MKLDGQSRATVSVPDDFESAQAKLVYLYLRVRSESTADEICTALDVDKGAVLSITRTLRNRGHLERVDGRYRLC
ncbi:MarR family transcriptional regulator [Natronococcus pandeyae]|uniref:MarR family transcriptional regulator n=1 Tax=Natronococcus pandeyae TaxID=2055836 RepID=A0A8J8Q4Y4_9EURY|nr:helix-turn-helix domain-containing protein [Natronococcus pandeyae]TYL37679.1 MarR family transcriptional regulator [Natronococcus pandeyae]